MLKQSKKMMRIISNNNTLHMIKCNNKTKHIFKQLYNEIIEANNYVKQLAPFKTTITNFTHRSQITKPKYFHSKSFPEIIRNHIDDNMRTDISFSFSLYEREVKVHFILENEVDGEDLELYYRYVQSIAMWLYMVNIYASKECVQTIDIYLYFTSLLKKLPSSNSYVLDEININTAFTSTCPANSEIVVFRKEEWFKVLIHETFHNFGLDFSNMNNNPVKQCILEIFDINSNVNAYEAYTEFWAEIINVLFCSYFELKDKTDIHTFLSTCEIYLHYERMYSFFQLVKTLRFMGLQYPELYSKREYAAVKREKLYKENTNVLSYYILKTILINNFQGFLSWCDKHNSSLLNFKKTTDNLYNYCEFIRKNYKTDSMLNSVYKSEHFFSQLRSATGNKHSIFSNMRMTICELG